MANSHTILHLIQNLGRGGAETALVGVLRELREYRNILVTMDGLNEFDKDIACHKHYNLNLSNYVLFPAAIPRLRRIITKESVDLVHSQLLWSTFLARFSTPRKLPLVTTIQASLSNSVEYRKRSIVFTEKLSYYYRPSLIVGVSSATLSDYFSFLQLGQPTGRVLYNFVDTSEFSPSATRKADDTFRLVSVGNLKEQKNHSFLIEAMGRLRSHNITLDIYGEGNLREQLEAQIARTGARVKLHGSVNNIRELLSGYDLFVMASSYEGFSLAVLESMATKVPLFLSNIPTFHEQCGDSAAYFNLDSTDSFVRFVIKSSCSRDILHKLAEDAFTRVNSRFTLKHHLDALRQIYSDLLGANH